MERFQALGWCLSLFFLWFPCQLSGCQPSSAGQWLWQAEAPGAQETVPGQIGMWTSIWAPALGP